MHEQDIRRALDMPGNLNSAPAVHSTDYLLESLPYVVGKRAKAPVGSVVRLEVTGHAPVAAVVGDDGRGRTATAADGDPALTLPWTARPSWCWPADAGRPSRVSSASPATPSWAHGCSPAWA